MVAMVLHNLEMFFNLLTLKGEKVKSKGHINIIIVANKSSEENMSFA